MSPATMRVTLRLRTALGLPHSETLFADHAGPGRFRLLSNSYFAPMAVGDIVRVVEGREGLIIAGLAEAGPMAVSVIVIDRQVSLDDVKSIADSWRARGASWSEEAFGILTTVWQPHLPADDVFDLLVSNLRGRPGWSTPTVYAPEDRTNELLRRVAHVG